MTKEKELVSLSGAPIWKHKERTKPFELAIGDEGSLEEISAHIDRFVGPVEMVWHEIISDLVHVDLHHVGPTPDRDSHVLITSGMSDRPMCTPEGVAGCQFAELLITLPASWPLKQDAFKDEANYWPIRMVKQFARMPHEYDTWLWWAHTVDNGDPAEPFHPSTKQQSAILAPPILLPEAFSCLETSSGRTIEFFSVIPIYAEELKFKMNRGAEALFDRFDEHGVTELIDPGRKNTCASWWQKLFA